MRLAVVSDIHGNLPALQAVLDDFAHEAVDGVINLGDSLSGPLQPLETAQFLMAQSWTQLAGNHERQVLTMNQAEMIRSDRFARERLGAAELAWMASLKPCQRYNDQVLLCHGSPRSDLEYLLETVEPHEFRLATGDEIAQRLEHVDAELVLCGHSHIARVVQAPGGQLIVNPGSVGLQAYDDEAPYLHFVEAGSPHARYAMVERRAGRWRVELRSVPYDHLSMARLASQGDRPDWAHALITGYSR
jgi:predicted phosphodiesterase